jgi:DNA repair exonuclease SbcCD nuclease subunit
MKIAHISDLHLQEKVRFKPTLAVLNQFSAEVKKLEVDLVCVTGDIAGKDAPHRMSPRERLGLASWFRKLSETCPVLLLRGNHDQPGDPFIFEKCGATHPIRYVEDIERVDDFGLPVVCIPYTPIRGYGADLARMTSAEAHATALQRLHNIIQTLCVTGPAILLGHMPVFGVSTGTFEITSQRDLCPPVDFFQPFGFLYVGLGHIHTAQHVYGRVFYAGSPYPTDHGDIHGEKGFNFIDTADGVYSKPLVSWNMGTYHLKYINDGGFEPMPDQPWLFYHTKKELDNTYCRVIIHISDYEYRNTVNMSLIQQHILMNGGFVEKIAFQPIQNASAPATATPTPPATTLQTPIDRIVGQIQATGCPAEIQERAMQILEETPCNMT